MVVDQIPPQARVLGGMLTGSAMLGPQELFATVTIGGRGSEAKHVQYPLQRGPPTQVHGHCGISGIEAKLLVGDDARWFPSAFPGHGWDRERGAGDSAAGN